MNGEYEELAEHLRPIARTFYETLVRARRDGRITPEKPMRGGEIVERWPVLKTDRDIRDLVSYWRSRGALIASNGSGYFYATSAVEMEPTLRHLISRRNKLSALISALETACAVLSLSTDTMSG